MALGKTHRILIQLLKVCEIDEEGIVGIMLMLQEEDQVRQMIDWIDQNPTASKSQILMQVAELAICEE